MALIDTIKKNCPYCGLEGTIKQFIGWEENGKRSFQGQTDDGFLIILCPRCRKKIRYDIQINKFLSFSSEEDWGPKKSPRLGPLCIGLASFSGSLYLILAQNGWWWTLLGVSLLVFGWFSIKSVFKKPDVLPQAKKSRRSFFNKPERNVKSKL